MEDIVNRLRGFKSAAAKSWAHEAANEIESLRSQLAEVTMERNEFKEAHEFTFEQYQGCGRVLNETCAQLEATHAHTARLAEALSEYARKEECEGFYESAAHKALSSHINLDALHELQVKAARWDHLDGAVDVSPYLREYHSGVCLSVDAIDAHRAKKDSRQ